MAQHAAAPLGQHLETRKTAASRLAVDVQTIDKMITDGRLDAVRIGRAVRIRSSDVDAIIAGEVAVA